jgi:phosphohistidine phosphatase SixA
MLAIVVALGVAFAIWRSAYTTVVVLVRPADKEAGTIDDPPLSPDGEQRAQMLAQMFGATSGVGRVEAIFVSEGRRAQQIIAPLAERLGQRPVIVPGNDAGAVANRITRGHDGAAVLFVGNRSLVPQLVRELSGIEPAASTDREHDTLYVVSIPTYGRANVLQLKY